MSRDADHTAGEGPPDMAERVAKLLLESGNCAQTAFAVLEENFDLEGGQVLRALTALPGVALRGETCGAVTGSLMALGLVYGRDDLADWQGYLRSLPSARRFCARFEEANGGTACAAVLRHVLGRPFDLADRAGAMAYAAAGGPQACAGVVASAVSLASEEIRRRK